MFQSTMLRPSVTGMWRAGRCSSSHVESRSPAYRASFRSCSPILQYGALQHAVRRVSAVDMNATQKTFQSIAFLGVNLIDDGDGILLCEQV